MRLNASGSLTSGAADFFTANVIVNDHTTKIVLMVPKSTQKGPGTYLNVSKPCPDSPKGLPGSWQNPPQIHQKIAILLEIQFTGIWEWL